MMKQKLQVVVSGRTFQQMEYFRTNQCMNNGMEVDVPSARPEIHTWYFRINRAKGLTGEFVKETNEFLHSAHLAIFQCP